MNILRLFFIACFLGGLMLFSSCELINPPEAIPAYLKVESPLVRVDPGRSFTASAGVKDIWVSRNDDNLGIYPVPSVLPFLPEEKNEFTINGGIFLSGFSSFREPYPFWKAVQFEVMPSGLDTIVIQPIFEYYSPDSVLVFKYEEKFEGASFLLLSALSGNAHEVRLERSTEGFDGQAGILNFNSVATEMELVSNDWFLLPQMGNNRIFLEVTYKNNVGFTAGLDYRNAVDIGRLGGEVFVNSKGEWNTVYFDFNDQVRSLPAEMEFRLFFRASSSGDLGSISLDNIRLVHFVE